MALALGLGVSIDKQQFAPAGAPPGPFVPADFGTLTVNFDADDATASGDDVTGWNDQVSARVATPQDGPTVGPTFGGHASVELDGVANYFAVGGAVGDIIDADAFEIHAVVEFITFVNPGHYAFFADMDLIFGDSLEYCGLGADSSGGGEAIAAAYSSGYHVLKVGLATGALHVLSMRLASGTLYLSVDGGAEQTAAYDQVPTLTGALRIGHGASTYANARIAQILVYRGATSAGLVAGLKNKFGIALPRGTTMPPDYPDTPPTTGWPAALIRRQDAQESLPARVLVAAMLGHTLSPYVRQETLDQARDLAVAHPVLAALSILLPIVSGAKWAPPPEGSPLRPVWAFWARYLAQTRWDQWGGALKMLGQIVPPLPPAAPAPAPATPRDPGLYPPAGGAS